jgi:hypothetical protein
MVLYTDGRSGFCKVKGTTPFFIIFFILFFSFPVYPCFVVSFLVCNYDCCRFCFPMTELLNNLFFLNWVVLRITCNTHIVILTGISENLAIFLSV